MSGLLERLAAARRPSASAGSRAAAEMVRAELAALGLDAWLERERVHGTYWWPAGIACAAALPGRRTLAAAAALAAFDDLDLGPRLLRRALPHRSADNVVARAGPRDAPRTLVVHAHHDAAHTGLVFHPAIARAAVQAFGRVIERHGATPVAMAGAVAGPALVAAGARRAGRLLSAGFLAAMADVGARGSVPGANDNLSGVAALVELARLLAADPPRRLRVLLVSTDAEESFLEGMVRFGARHFPRLPRATTTFLCLESVGSPRLMLLDGEGLIRLHRYPPEPSAALTEEARALGIDLRPPFRYRFATDGQVPARAGYPAAVLTSMDPALKAPSNYHWPTDVPENLDRGSIAGATALAHALARRLDAAA